MVSIRCLYFFKKLGWKMKTVLWFIIIIIIINTIWGEWEAQERPRKEVRMSMSLCSADRQTERSESCYMCLVGMAGLDAVVRLVDKGHGQKAKNCESDPPTACFMTKVLSTTPAGFLVSTWGTKPIEQPQKVISTTPTGLVSTGRTKPIEQRQKVLSNNNSSQFGFNQRN
jgi:hypothetical protein